jgi:hypothetical protein
LIEWEKKLLEKESSLTLKVSELKGRIENSKLLCKEPPGHYTDLLRRAELILKVTGSGRGVHNYEESLNLLDSTDQEISQLLEKKH